MGLTRDEIRNYWTRRAEVYAQRRWWGPGAATPEEHIAQVAKRADFIFETCPRTLRTLDYGCGIGRYSQYFDADKYCGVDISKPYLKIAHEDNPDREFVQIASPIWDEPLDWDIEIFFTATVLQHCSDEVIGGLFANLAKKQRKQFAFSLYEYANPDWTVRQTVGRPPAEYVKMVGRHFHVLSSMSHDHMIHGTCCAHTVISAAPFEVEA